MSSSPKELELVGKAGASKWRSNAKDQAFSSRGKGGNAGRRGPSHVKGDMHIENSSYDSYKPMAIEVADLAIHIAV